MGMFRLSLLLTLASAALFGQPLGNDALNGKYNARHLMLNVNAAGAITDARTFYGSLTFDGSGNFTYLGSQLVGAAAPLPFTGSGKYTVQATGYFSLTNFQRTDGAVIRCGLGQGALVGSTQETAGVYDFLIAVPAPATGLGVQTSALIGTYFASTLEFPGGTAAGVRSTSFPLKPNGSGSFGDVAVSGKAANLQDKVISQTVAAASYALTADGSGTATFPLSSTSSVLSQLLSGSRQIYFSADTNFVIGGSNTAGGHDLLIATKAFSGTANAGSLRNLFFTAGMKLEPNRPGSYGGSANANGTGKLVSSRRVRQLEGVLDFTGGSNYAITADGSGSVETNRLALGSAGANYIVNGLSITDSNNYEIGFGIRATAASATGTLYINPQGIVNAASFAPVGAPVSPGEFLSIFGAGFATATTIAAGAPFPSTLGGVQVLVNNTPAPLYFVSAGQISCLVPFGVTGATASFVVTTGGKTSNAVELPLARTSPGIFTVPSAGTGPGAILKADYTLVSASNPAKRGDVVQVFLTGLGSVTPAGRDGALAPSNPLSIVPGTLAVYIGGKPADILFQGLAPGLIGLYQLNVKVPGNAPTGTNVSFAIDSGDSFHDMVDIAVVP